MLKFHIPFYPKEEPFFKIMNSTTSEYDFAKKDIEFVKKEYDIDLFANYCEKKFMYFQNDFIYIQPWAPRHSSESRLFVSYENLNKPFISYDESYDNKFYFFTTLRYFKFYSIFYDELKHIDNLHYDGCNDCAREIMILMDYINNTTNYISNNYKYDINNIKVSLKDKNKINKLIELYNSINKFTFFDLSSKNYKCHHGTIKNQKDYIEYNINGHIVKL